MRIWDVDPERLCRAHLLGEHRELHGLWNILTEGKEGYRRHPETRRWEGRLAALHARHERLAQEIGRRGWSHRSPLDPARATGSAVQDVYVDPPERQLHLLASKPCPCPLPLTASPASPPAPGGSAGPA
jgi:hypothetical protein